MIPATLEIHSTERRPEECHILANMAEAFAKLGDVEESRKAFAEAVRLADLDDTNTVFVLANQAAEIGAKGDAIELLARFVTMVDRIERESKSAIDVLRAASAKARESYSQSYVPVLRQVVAEAELASATWERLRPLHQDNGEQPEDTEHLKVFEQTRLYRGAANVAVMNSEPPENVV